jgi:hypothetical protein
MGVMKSGICWQLRHLIFSCKSKAISSNTLLNERNEIKNMEAMKYLPPGDFRKRSEYRASAKNITKLNNAEKGYPPNISINRTLF